MARRQIDQNTSTFLALRVVQSASVLGSGAASFALGLLVFEATGSTTKLALITAVSMFAGIYLAPLAGAVSDHLGHSSTAVLCNGALTITSLGLGGFAAAGAAAWFLPVLGLVFVAAVLNAALSVTLTASVREMRGDSNLTRINGLTSLLERGPVIVAPTIGTVSYASVGPSAVFVLDAVTFALGAAVVLLVDWRSPVRPPGRRLRPFVGAARGLRCICDTPSLRSLQLTFAGINLCNGFGVAAVTGFVIAAARANGDDPVVRSV